jgi:hypothetical protein
MDIKNFSPMIGLLLLIRTPGSHTNGARIATKQILKAIKKVRTHEETINLPH